MNIIIVIFNKLQVSTVLEEARSVAGHAKKKNIDCEDVKLAGILLSERNQCSPPPRELLLELARGRNVCPLPLVKPHCGLRLPPDRYCLSSCNYRLTSDQNVRRTAGSTVHRGIQQVGSGAGVALKRPGIVTVPKTQTVNAPKPVFKFSTGKTPMKTDDGGKMDIDTDGQALKRKREDDDYDAL